jgi:hypothetical protein
MSWTATYVELCNTVFVSLMVSVNTEFIPNRLSEHREIRAL